MTFKTYKDNEAIVLDGSAKVGYALVFWSYK